jgi:hypothetical protein
MIFYVYFAMAKYHKLFTATGGEKPWPKIQKKPNQLWVVTMLFSTDLGCMHATHWEPDKCASQKEPTVAVGAKYASMYNVDC